MEHKEYLVFQGIEDKRKVYVAVPADETPDEAIRIANDKFRLNKLCLKVEAGYIHGKDLFLGFCDIKKSIPVWVVTKKAR